MTTASLAAAPESPDFSPIFADRTRFALTVSVIAHLFLVLGVSFALPDADDAPVLSSPLRVTLVFPNRDQDTPNPNAEAVAEYNNRGENAKNFSPPLPPADLTFNDTAADSAFTAPSAERKKAREALVREIVQSQNQLAAKPREWFTNANAKEDFIAAYIERWRLRTESIGNLNYPDAAKRRGLRDSLVLEVVLTADGRVVDLILPRASEYSILNESAKRIVRLAAPFEKFTPKMAAKFDKLHIIRTWHFDDGRLATE